MLFSLSVSSIYCYLHLNLLIIFTKNIFCGISFIIIIIIIINYFTFF